MLFIFSTPELIRHLWQLKTAVFPHWRLIRAVLLSQVLSQSAFTNLQNIATIYKLFTKIHKHKLILKVLKIGKLGGLV
jgi:hypothetical protein